MKYDGEFVDDAKQGFGIYNWTDGRKYTGWWYKGRQHGFGTYLDRRDGDSQKVKYGLWEHGKRIKWFDESDLELAEQGKFDYLQYYKNQDENQDAPFKGHGFSKPKGWDESMNDCLKTLLDVPG